MLCSLAYVQTTHEQKRNSQAYIADSDPNMTISHHVFNHMSSKNDVLMRNDKNFDSSWEDS